MAENTWYIVSADPEQLLPQGGSGQTGMAHYQTPEDAGDGIRQGYHGEVGRLYILKVELTVEATATRGWELRSGSRVEWNPNAPADPFEDPPSPTGSGV
jgi:hypothetical protein